MSCLPKLLTHFFLRLYAFFSVPTAGSQSRPVANYVEAQSSGRLIVFYERVYFLNARTRDGRGNGVAEVLIWSVGGYREWIGLGAPTLTEGGGVQVQRVDSTRRAALVVGTDDYYSH